MRYVATVKNVREVVLEGRADLEYWTRHLEPMGLAPKAVDGEAELAIAAFRSRWMGIPFGEAVVFLSVGPARDEDDRDDYFLLRAFNSNRFFTFSTCSTYFRHCVLNVPSNLRISSLVCSIM